jgi:hypothetical protein
LRLIACRFKRRGQLEHKGPIYDTIAGASRIGARAALPRSITCEEIN